MSQIQEIEEIKKLIIDHYHEGHAKHDYRFYEGFLSCCHYGVFF